MMLINRLFPTASFNDMRHEMDRVLNAITGSNGARSFGSGSYPPVNIWEDGQSYFVEAEIPGVDMNDIELQVVGNELTLQGKRTTAGSESSTFHQRERGSGEFGRACVLYPRGNGSPSHDRTGHKEALRAFWQLLRLPGLYVEPYWRQRASRRRRLPHRSGRTRRRTLQPYANRRRATRLQEPRGFVPHTSSRNG